MLAGTVLFTHIGTESKGLKSPITVAFSEKTISCGAVVSTSISSAILFIGPPSTVFTIPIETTSVATRLFPPLASLKVSWNLPAATPTKSISKTTLVSL